MNKRHAPDPESRELSRFFAELDRAEAAELTREIAGETPAEPLPPQLERRLLRTRRAAALRRGLSRAAVWVLFALSAAGFTALQAGAVESLAQWNLSLFTAEDGAGSIMIYYPFRLNSQPVGEVEFGWLPDGFAPDETGPAAFSHLFGAEGTGEEADAARTYCFRNGERTFSLAVTQPDSIFVSYAGIEDAAAERLTLKDGQEAVCIAEEGSTILLWHDGRCQYYLIGDLSREEAIRVAEEASLS
ncbi:MAG TPA: DUF4367 domain-containing protein [Candidatus Merdivicinus faecavium]|nr:DUF4367 domain-containing protein [Candidatus Merdivicinus faecavium]